MKQKVASHACYAQLRREQQMLKVEVTWLQNFWRYHRPRHSPTKLLNVRARQGINLLEELMLVKRKLGKSTLPVWRRSPATKTFTAKKIEKTSPVNAH